MYKTPGVYVEEIATLPPSVAEVSTAVPAFFGYTQTRPSTATGPVVGRISTMVEFEQLFGGAKPTSFIVTTQAGPANSPPTIQSITASGVTGSVPNSLLYYAVSHYFANGGGPCYIVSLGDYSASLDRQSFLTGLEMLALQDEPTLIVLTDAVGLNQADYFAVAQKALDQCNTLKDRFVILDVPGGAVDAFRQNIGTNSLSYAAAYHPYLATSLSFAFTEDGVQLKPADPPAPVTPPPNPPTTPPAATVTQTLTDIRYSQTALYNQIKSALAGQRVTLPPSAAIAGIYAATDRDRGVWKAPANVSVASVIGATAKMTDADQEGLNIDPTAGKSINAIRDFVGKGTLVWGARTLAGNDNEWRYISVRRLFITIEENVKKATAFAVFEPNDATTWLKVRGMIESYLYSLWERGALAGSKPEDAYYVNVGLGKTMTAQDILEGRMIVQIGVATVRPAEFIVLRFMHKLQTA